MFFTSKVKPQESFSTSKWIRKKSYQFKADAATVLSVFPPKSFSHLLFQIIFYDNTACDGFQHFYLLPLSLHLLKVLLVKVFHINFITIRWEAQIFFRSSSYLVEKVSTGSEWMSNNFSYSRQRGKTLIR